MITSDLGREFIKSYEKCRLRAYDDGVGVWTIGWGHTAGVKYGDECSIDQANAWLDEELEVFQAAVNNAVKVPLSQHQFDALVSFSYNVGTGALRSSTLLKLLNLGNYAGAANRFEDWNKGMIGGKLAPIGGLTKRRKAERRIFENGEYEMHQ